MFTTSASVVDNVAAPAEVLPPAGWVRVTLSVTPDGMLASIDAVILRSIWFVVIEYVPAAVAWVGCEPAVAVLIVSDGVPVTEILLMAWTSNVTTCVAVWACATPLIARLNAPQAMYLVYRDIVLLLAKKG